MLRHLLAVTIIALALAVIITPVGTVNAAKESSKKEGSDVEGSGFSLFETESIKGFDEKKVEMLTEEVNRHSKENRFE